MQEIADTLHGYADLGCSQVMVEFAPYDHAGLDRFAEVVRRIR